MGGVQTLAGKLKMDLTNGIDGNRADIELRRKKYGSNVKNLLRIKTLLELIIEQFQDRILQALLVAAGIALIIGVAHHRFPNGMIESISIMFAVAIIVSVTACANHMKDKQFQMLGVKASEKFIACYRGTEGLTITIPDSELVVGDLVKIETGMKIPADCILITGTDIKCEESNFTGEFTDINK